MTGRDRRHHDLWTDAGVDHSDIASLSLLDPAAVDWPRVQRTAYLIHQRLRYDYNGPIAQLLHRLVIVPPLQHGDQRLLLRRIEVAPGHGVSRSDSIDELGNNVMEFSAPRVDSSITFEAWLAVERQTHESPHLVDAALAADSRLLRPSRLTKADASLRAMAREMAATGLVGLELAAHINATVHQRMTYAAGITHVGTDAAAALKLGRGVCQDYAHVMIAVARLCGLATRYVSGHLLGEGGTHAWVEVVLPDVEDPSRAIVHAFDPTHGRFAGLRYLTVAVGRDYREVAPTSGSYTSRHAGALQARKRVGVVQVDYAA